MMEELQRRDREAWILSIAQSALLYGIGWAAHEHWPAWIVVVLASLLFVTGYVEGARRALARRDD